MQVSEDESAAAMPGPMSPLCRALIEMSLANMEAHGYASAWPFDVVSRLAHARPFGLDLPRR
jgi:hypothetical protein